MSMLKDHLYNHPRCPLQRQGDEVARSLKNHRGHFVTTMVESLACFTLTFFTRNGGELSGCTVSLLGQNVFEFLEFSSGELLDLLVSAWKRNTSNVQTPAFKIS